MSSGMHWSPILVSYCILHGNSTWEVPQWDPWQEESTWRAGRSAHWFVPCDRASWFSWRFPVKKQHWWHGLSRFTHQQITWLRQLVRWVFHFQHYVPKVSLDLKFFRPIFSLKIQFPQKMTKPLKKKDYIYLWAVLKRFTSSRRNQWTWSWKPQ